MKIRLLWALALVMLCSGVCFAETTIKAGLDKQSVSQDETVTYKVTVVSTERAIPPPAFPDFTKGLAVLSQVQSSSISFTAGGMKTMLVYVFVLLPRQAGSLEIGPSVVTANGKKVTSEKFTLQVKPSGNKPLPRDSGGMPRFNL